MADTYTISAAARVCHRDRRTLQRAIRAGLLHLDAQHRLSRDELLQLGYLEEATPQPVSQLPPQPVTQAMPQIAAALALLERLTAILEAIQQELHQIHEAVRQVPQPAPQQAPQGMSQPAPQQAQDTEAAPYDATKYVLGRLCRRGHAYGQTGKTLLSLPARQCRQCQAERARERRAAKREGPA